MGWLVDRLYGPFFGFLVIEQGQLQEWNEERIEAREIYPEEPFYLATDYFHHPGALRISDDLMTSVYHCFRESHPDFNYYGSMEYSGAELDRLLMWLRVCIEGIRACRQPKEFERYTKNLEYALKETKGPWQDYWLKIRDEIADCFEDIFYLAYEAKESGKALLVLGV